MTGWAERVSQAYAVGLDVPVTLEEGFGPLAVDVPAERWVESVTLARDTLGCTFFDWLSAVDGGGGRPGFQVVCHLVAHRPGCLEHLLLRTLVPHDDAVLPSVAGAFAGAGWHERETHEMFGIDFTDHGARLDLAPLLLPDEFTGHPLRKDFVLASRVVRAWPGAKEPGESDATVGGRARRRVRPPGVPEPGEWGSQ